jgi:GT2 family glycosyltransferase
MSRIAVVVVNYNGGSMLLECLASLAAQTVSADRVLIYDNGSTDGSLEAARQAHPWAEYHASGVNHGFARGNNLAVALVADCEWIALLNPDAFPAPDWIEAFHRRAAEFPDTDVFASCMLSARVPGIIDGAGDLYRVDGIAWPRFHGGPVAELPEQADDVFAACAGAGFYRRAAFVAAGGFAERYFCYYEDVDLSFRLRLRGHTCRFLPDVVVRHVGSAVSGEGSDFSVYHVHRNVCWTFVRNMPGVYFWVYLPAHVLANLMTVAVFVRKGRGRVILRAKWHALRGLPGVLRERRAVQAARRTAAARVVGSMRPGNVLTSLYSRARRQA